MCIVDCFREGQGKAFARFSISKFALKLEICKENDLPFWVNIRYGTEVLDSLKSRVSNSKYFSY